MKKAIFILLLGIVWASCSVREEPELIDNTPVLQSMEKFPKVAHLMEDGTLVPLWDEEALKRPFSLMTNDPISDVLFEVIGSHTYLVAILPNGRAYIKLAFSTEELSLRLTDDGSKCTSSGGKCFDCRSNGSYCDCNNGVNDCSHSQGMVGIL